VCLCTAKVLAAGVSRRAWLFFAACALCAVDCGPTGNDVHAGARGSTAAPQTRELEREATQKRARKKPSNEPVIDGTRCAALVPFLPATFEGYRAKAGAEGKDIDLGEGAGVALLKRGYYKSGTSLDIEIVDTEQAKPLRALFEETRELERDTDVAVIKSMRIQGHKAVAQWNSTSKSARVAVLVEGRYLVNLNLRPADSIATSVALAEKFELAQLAKLQSADEIAAH
jgi:hypothetical protein